MPIHEEPERDYLAEAYAIVRGQSIMVPEYNHLTAMYHEIARRTEFESEARDLQATLDLVHGADRRAIAKWQAETGRILTWPDRTEMIVWLLRKIEVLEEFQRDIEAVGIEQVKEDWPDLAETYQKTRG